MKIRSQFNLLIVGIVLIPIATITILPVYHYMSSPQRILLKGYKDIRSIRELNLTEDDWTAVKEKIKKVPPNVQVSFYYNSTILISNIPELKVGMIISPLEIFEFMKNTNNLYDYQFQTPLPPHETLGKSTNSKVLVITRVPVYRPGRQKKHNVLYALVFVILFELFCLNTLVGISKSIYKSVSMLERETNKIASGNLDVEIKAPKSRRLANEITSIMESLEKMRLSLKEDADRRTKFIMGISHDLRTPVALIKGYAEAITDGVVTDMDSVRKSLSIIDTKADQLESMINDLINYVKLNNSDWVQTLEKVRLQPFLEDFAKGISLESELYNRKINTFIDIPPSIEVPLDKNLINRALENLFNNAVRYTNDGDSINVSAVQEGTDILVSVADTGIGINEKELEHIYDIFYRGTNSRREGGMGIGLSVVKTIIDSHGWKIEVNSKINEGTTFFIRIPLKKADEEN